MVILVLGLPGSGKSYFAERLAQKIRAEYFNSDQIRKEMFADRTYSDLEKARVYEALLKKMQEAIDKEKDVVLDATFYKNKIRECMDLDALHRNDLSNLPTCLTVNRINPVCYYNLRL